MDTSKQIVSQPGENCATLAQGEFLVSLGELNALHARITRNEGEVAAKLDEVEKFTEVRLNQIKSLRDMVREDQKNMRRIEAKLFKATQKRLAVTQSS